MSPRTLQRRCQAVRGKSPLAYFQDLRVERAKLLVHGGGRDLDFMVAEVGYVDGTTLGTLLLTERRAGCSSIAGWRNRGTLRRFRTPGQPNQAHGRQGSPTAEIEEVDSRLQIGLVDHRVHDRLDSLKLRHAEALERVQRLVITRRSHGDRFGQAALVQGLPAVPECCDDRRTKAARNDPGKIRQAAR